MVKVSLSRSDYSFLIRGLNQYLGLLLSLYDEPSGKIVLDAEHCKGLSLYLDSLDALLDTLLEAAEGQE